MLFRLFLSTVNVLGVANGLRAFTEYALSQPEDEPSAFVGTASAAGLAPSLTGPYSASKYACRNIMEQLYADVHRHPQGRDGKLSVHLLCPTFFPR